MESYAPWVESVSFFDTIDINEHLLSVKVELGDVMYFFVATAWNIRLSFFSLAYFSPKLSKATSSEDYTRWYRHGQKGQKWHPKANSKLGERN